MREASTVDAATLTVSGAVHLITGAADACEGFFDLVDDRRFVLIGEASHGRHEFLTESRRASPSGCSTRTGSARSIRQPAN
jgi:erythromycin esterase-like protein